MVWSALDPQGAGARLLFTIPLALVGAVAALFLTRSPVSVVVFIGLILLIGIVVKNAIILIDKVNQLREEGMPKREAISDISRVLSGMVHGIMARVFNHQHLTELAAWSSVPVINSQLAAGT